MRRARTDQRRLAFATMLVLGGSLAAFLVISFGPHPEVLLPFAMGGALIAYGVRCLLHAASAKRWERVPAVVIWSDIEEAFVGYPEYVPVIRFEYLTGQGRLVSDRLSIAVDDFRGEEQQARELLEKFQVGSKIDAYVKPDDPQYAVALNYLSRKRRSHYWACIAGGSLIAGIGILLAMHGLGHGHANAFVAYYLAMQ